MLRAWCCRRQPWLVRSLRLSSACPVCSSWGTSTAGATHALTRMLFQRCPALAPCGGLMVDAPCMLGEPDAQRKLGTSSVRLVVAGDPCEQADTRASKAASTVEVS